MNVVFKRDVKLERLIALALFKFGNVSDNRFSRNIELIEQISQYYNSPLFDFGEERIYWICGVMNEYLDSLNEGERNLLVEKAFSQLEGLFGCEEFFSTQEYADLIDELAGLKEANFGPQRMDLFINFNVTYTEVNESILGRIKN